MKILLIDNHALFRDGLRYILQRLHGGVGEILEAGNFSDGLELAGQNPDLALALLELKSPGSEGAVSVGFFRQHYPHIPVVVVSSEEDCHVINKALDYGASGFVCKSSPASILLDALKLALSGNIYVPEQLLRQHGITAVHEGHRNNRHSNPDKHNLTTRQAHILRCLATGLSNKEIAGLSNLSEGTVKAHVAAVYQTLQVKNRMEAAQVAWRLGLDDKPCA